MNEKKKLYGSFLSSGFNYFKAEEQLQREKRVSLGATQ